MSATSITTSGKTWPHRCENCGRESAPLILNGVQAGWACHPTCDHRIGWDTSLPNDPEQPPVDEVAGQGHYHAERLDEGVLWLQLGPDVFVVCIERYGFLWLKQRLRFVHQEHRKP